MKNVLKKYIMQNILKSDLVKMHLQVQICNFNEWFLWAECVT